ncbi:hypothetical protein [Streptomyces noursei]|uniref:hypothetical protein n=1 Tax=Streptomyces noursei TaxID=1971 RepID=UPI0005C91E76|nr:hypothetical protein [Streptomyces noursei]
MRDHAPVVVHRLSASGGRRVTVRDQILGLAYSDADLAEFLRRAGVADPQAILDDPAWIEWRDGEPHEYGTRGPHSA